jgi:hypothetical protein
MKSLLRLTVAVVVATAALIAMPTTVLASINRSYSHQRTCHQYCQTVGPTRRGHAAVASVTATEPVSQTGFQWRDATIGAAVGVSVMLVAFSVFWVVRDRGRKEGSRIAPTI